MVDTITGTSLSEVQFGFESPSDPDTPWRVVRMHVREGMNEVYEGVLDLATSSVDATPEPLIGQPCKLTITRAAVERRFCGIVRRAEDLGTTGGHRLVRVFLVPQLWQLSLRVNSRIYQNLNVLDVVKEVLKDADLYQDTVDELIAGVTPATYPVREYCVQYRETDLAFVMRLLEAEGVGFYFTHAGDTEALVLTDEVSSLPTVTGLVDDIFPVAGTEASTSSVETVRRLDWSRDVRPSAVTLRDFDFTRPLAQSDMTRSNPGSVGALEVYEYPGFYTINEYNEGEHVYREHGGRRLAENRQLGHLTWEKQGRGLGNGAGFTPGHVFELARHGRDELNQRYYLTRIEHVGVASEELTSDVSQQRTGDDRYHNRFECTPVSVAYRPRRVTPRPVVQGPQTATVTAAPDTTDEICTDFHGRILVRFHWERPEFRPASQRPLASSCWVRVAQLWAGPGWGFVFIPRVDMEVVVTFLEGDPDRPLVTGCVYNGANNTPYPLPEEKTRSTIKTNSSPTSGGYNELRFEDLAGSEEIYLQAQKDFNELVKHNHGTTVRANQTNSVSGNQSESVGGNQTMTVKKDRTKVVEGKEDNTVKNQRWTTIQGGYDSLHVEGNQDIMIDGPGGAAIHVIGHYGMDATDRITLDVGQTTNVTMTTSEITASTTSKIKLKAGSAEAEMVPGKITLKSGGGAQITLEGDRIDIKAATVNVEGTTTLNLTGPTTNIICTGTLDAGSGTITIHGSDTTVSGNGATVHLHGVADVTASVINLNG